MRLIINTCYGGFSLSPAGIKRWAELKGRECYFFKQHLPNEDYVPLAQEDCQGLFWSAFDIANPDEVFAYHRPWEEMTLEERRAHNELYGRHSLNWRDIPRDDPDLVRTVEELGCGHREGASGECAQLRIVEIPDGVEYTIEEYDGTEWVEESHRTWR